MKTTKAERDEWRLYNDSYGRVGALVTSASFKRLLDDADELARLREGLLALPLIGCTVVPPVEETMVHWENIVRLLGDGE